MLILLLVGLGVVGLFIFRVLVDVVEENIFFFNGVFEVFILFFFERGGLQVVEEMVFGDFVRFLVDGCGVFRVLLIGMIVVVVFLVVDL